MRRKFGDKMVEGIFLGYEENRVGWRVHDIHGTYHFSDQVVFNESLSGCLSGPKSVCNLSTPLDSSPRGPRPQCTVKPTERGKEWQEGIRCRDEHLNTIWNRDDGPLPQHSESAQSNIAALVDASEILDNSFPDLHADCEFFFAALANVPTLSGTSIPHRTT